MFFSFFVLLVSSKGVFKIEGENFTKDGEKFQIISGAFHYFRQVPELWEETIMKMAHGGLNTIETYVAWNIHEKEKGKFTWDGYANITRFLDLCMKYNMSVILRPGPYICAEWEFGGFPYWLLNEDIEFLRYSDETYLKHVTDWFNVLFPKLKKYIYSNGGCIIVIQIENEYGAYFSCDTDYLNYLYDLNVEHFGTDIVYTTVNNPYDFMHTCGAISDKALATVDFGTASEPSKMYSLMKKWNNGTGPFMNTEFYSGWLDHWGEEHNTVSAGLFADRLDQILELGGNVNMYMYYGGTNFDYMNGANGDTLTWYLPDPSSYDYDAPLSEATDLTYKFEIIRRVIERYRLVPNYDVKNRTKIAYGELVFTGCLPLLDVLDEVSAGTVYSDRPLSFEELNQSTGFVLYSTTAKRNGILRTGMVFDRAVIMNDGVIVDSFLKNPDYHPFFDQDHDIDILVENTGRLNFGWDLMTDKKGLRDRVSLGGKYLTGWTMTKLPLPEWNFDLEFQPVNVTSQPMFLRGEFNVDTVADTYLYTKGLGRGVIFINGKYIGRYWSAGPQHTHYVRSTFLKEGVNEVVLFESAKISSIPNISFIDYPIIDGEVGSYV